MDTSRRTEPPQISNRETCNSRKHYLEKVAHITEAVAAMDHSPANFSLEPLQPFSKFKVHSRALTGCTCVCMCACVGSRALLRRESRRLVARPCRLVMDSDTTPVHSTVRITQGDKVVRLSLDELEVSIIL